MKELMLSETTLATSILLIRGKKVILDRDLAALYGIETKFLKRAVRRNIERFPEDFMFELTDKELANWRYQFGTSNADTKGLRYAPMAFTEQGVAMLSSVVNSSIAIEVNIAIIRTFVKMREWILENQELAQKFEKFEAILDQHGADIEHLFDTIDLLTIQPASTPRQLIGFKNPS